MSTSRRIAALLALTACSEPAAEQVAPPLSKLPPLADWARFDDAAKTFSARFPGPPVEQRRAPVPSADDPLALDASELRFADDHRLLTASSVTLSNVTRYDCDAGLDGMIKSSLESMGCTASESAPKTVLGLPGRELSFSCQKRPMQGKMRMACDSSRLAEHRVIVFSAMAALHHDAWDAELASGFLDGVELPKR